MSGRPAKPSYGNANAAPLGTRRPTNTNAAGSDSENSETDSSDETEDEDGEELTPVMDAAILRTLTRIRRGEGVEEGRNVFEEETAALLLSSASQPPPTSSNGLSKKPKQTKPFLLSDFQRQALLSSADPSSSFDPSLPRPPTHAEEQEALRQETLNAFKVDYGADGDDESGGLFSVRKEGVNGEEEMEDEEYRRFLLGSGGGEEGIREALGLGKKAVDGGAEQESDDDEGEDDLGEKVGEGEGEEKVEGVEGEKKKRKRVKRKPKVKVPLTEEEKKQKDEEFLLDYILNRGWIDRSQDHVPSYNEIVAKPKRSKKKADEENSDLSADEGGAAPYEEGFDDKAEEFETRYNFRFEEPGAAVIPTHPRALPALARRPDTARKDARELRKEKKAEEKAKREEERRKIKGEKRREMEKKLLLLGLGKDGKELTMDDLDLDADFDESAHDQKIAALFESGNDWGDDDGEKPTWDDEFGGEEGYAYGMEEGEEGAQGLEGGEGMDWGDEMMEEEEDDAPINMDADFMDEPSTSSRKDKKKKQKKKSKKSKDGAEDVEATEEAGEQEPEAPFVGTEEEKKKKVEEIMDEYYALDHEDMIGSLPTRFHYTKTTPQTYGLTPAEILLATDTELNTFLGVKQYAAYRSDGGAGAGRTGRDKRLWELRKALKGRTWGEETDLKKNKYGNGARGTGSNDVKVEGGGKGKKRKGKKERTREKAAEGGEGAGGEVVEEGSASKKRKVE